MENFDFYISSNGRLIIKEYDIDLLVDFNQSSIPSMPEAVESAVRIAGRDGDVPLKTTYEPLPFIIVAYTEDNLTPTEKRDIELKMDRFMHKMKNKKITFAMERDNKCYNVKYSGALTTVNYPMHLMFTIPVKSSDSYAKVISESEIVGNNSLESNTVEEVGAIFTILGPAQTPKISFNGEQMQYDNVIDEGASLVINSKNSTATMISAEGVKTNAMRYYNHIFPKVQPGVNELVIQSGIDDESLVKVEWNDLTF